MHSSSHRPLAPALAIFPILWAAQAPTPSAPTTQAAAPGAQAAFYWADFDGDGLSDAYAVQADGSACLLHNLGRSFEDATGLLGLDGTSLPGRAVWHDVDGDGAVDLFLHAPEGGARLLRNAGSLGFEDRTQAAGLAGLGGIESAAFVDADGDGLLDLHVTGAGGHRLFASRGDGTFEPVALALPPVVERVPVVGPALAGNASTDGAVADTGSSASGTGSAGNDAPPPSDREDTGRVAIGQVGSVTATTLLPGQSNVGMAALCTNKLTDQATNTCLEASSDPTYGMLYPLGDELFIDATGDVGIGNTTPSFRLHVSTNQANDGVAAFDNVNSAGFAGVYFQENSEGRGWVGHVNDDSLFGAPGTMQIGSQFDDLVFSASPDEFFQERMRISAFGNVGIGTINPLRRLHVRGATPSGGTPTTNSTLAVENGGEASVSILSGSSSEASLFLGNPGAGANAGAIIFNPFSGPANSMLFRTDDTNRVIIHENGNVGVGVDDPDAALHVGGTIRSGSEVGTTQGPETGYNYSGMVMRRTVSTVTTSGNVVARSQFMRIERDGSNGVMRLAWDAANLQDQVAYGTGLRANGTIVPIVINLGVAATAGSQSLYTATDIVRLDVAFGTTFNSRDHTELTLMRSAGDSWWIGSLRSTVDQ